MVETTPERPTKEPTSLEQMQEQVPSTIQTEAQIHFDEGGNASVETRSDKSEVIMVQPEPQENTQEQSVDIPPVRSGIQHSVSVSEEIESVEPDEPPTPTNEARDVIAQNLDIVQNLFLCLKKDWLMNMGLVMIIQPTMIAAYLVFSTSVKVFYLIKSSVYEANFRFDSWEIFAFTVTACLGVMFLLPLIWLFGLIKGGHETPFTEHFYMSLDLTKCAKYTEQNRGNENIRTNVAYSSV